ncbi:uncharacterized protein LOC118199914 isoform X2 [Stegodyphus dumicola]|uniref:uncharacterized protein LOC118199914 isoform X2 n=1 Tax=Stegodyphus dumicola TaxID=202533 RepID=UPI0015A764F6|nr:uncharacterized protein LOC118199914 isoform X2 [Stegodyphus dumicola]
MYVKKIIACIGTVAAMSTEKLQAKELVPCHECHMKRLPKASELPLYDKRGDQNMECVQVAEMSLVSEISIIRKQMTDYIAYFDSFRKKALNVYETGLAHSQSTFDYLKSEENKISRVMLIASGGLLGFIAARRGGIFRKIFYSSAGSAIIFSAFYPSLTKEYLLVSIDYTKNQTSSILEKYGGYDTKKIAEEANAKVDYLKSVMMYESLMAKLNELFYRRKNILTSSNQKSENHSDKAPDEDMYTTR